MLSFFLPYMDIPDIELDTMAWKYALRLECNSFNLWDQNYERRSMGIYQRASRLNHSCIPNLVREQHGNTLVFSALTHIYKNNEFTFSYIPLTYERTKRKDLLVTYFQFDCKCERCKSSPQMDRALSYKLGDISCGGTWTAYGVCAICGKFKTSI